MRLTALAVLMLVSCRSAPALQVDRCATDAECCDRCTPEPETAKSVAARDAACSEKRGGLPTSSPPRGASRAGARSS